MAHAEDWNQLATKRLSGSESDDGAWQAHHHAAHAQATQLASSRSPIVVPPFEAGGS